MNKFINKVVNLKITTLSPVAISDNDAKKLTPYADIILDKKDIVILDKDKLTDLIISDNNAFNMYLDILRNRRANNPNHYTIDKLMQYKGIKLSDVTYRKIKCKCDIKNLIEVVCCIKSNGKAFIPGSSIKGSVRTAILQGSLSKDQMIKNSQEYHKTYVGEDVFRNQPKNIQSDIFKHLIVRDTNCVTNENLSVYEAKSINLYKNMFQNNLRLDMRMLLECIDKNTVFDCGIVIKNDKFKKEDIFTSVNKYYERVILKEISEISKIKADITEIINEYNLLLDKIRRYINDKNGCIMRVGRLKGYFSNTITSQLDNKDIYRIIGKEKNKVKLRKVIGEFPTTKWVVCDGNKVKGLFGWIEVSENGKNSNN